MLSIRCLPHLTVAPLLLSLILLSFSSPRVLAAEEVLPTEEVQASIPTTLESPRATMGTFLGAMNDIKRGDPERIADAVATLDLSEVNALVRAERGADLAWMLLDIMDRTRLVDLKKVPARKEGKPWIFAEYQRGSMRISPGPDGRWLFDGTTVQALPAIHDELAGTARVVGDEQDSAHLPLHLRLRNHIPGSLKQRTFLLENWRWLALLVIAAAGVVLDWLVSALLRVFMRGWRQRSGHEAFRDVSDRTLRPLGMLVMAAYRLVDLVSAWLEHRARMTTNKIDDVLAPLITHTLKIFVTVAGLIFIADNLNIDVTGLVAGLGLGGLAFALAAKDMVQNLFGSITVLLDRTFTVGDWIKVGDQAGSVERMGFRSTRIRTFYNSVVTVPYSKFITADVDNIGERRYRRLSTKFTIAYDTPPDRIEAFCEGVREIVRQHPYMRKELLPRLSERPGRLCAGGPGLRLLGNPGLGYRAA